METIERILLLAGAWIALSGGITLLFERVGNTASQEGKKRAADWLKSLAKKSTSKTIVESPQWFIEAFDSIFGEKHLTLRCFLISCVISISTVILITILYVTLFPTSFLNELEVESIKYGIAVVLIGALFFNLFPDYFSLLETRWILHHVKHSNFKKLCGFLILDAIITGLVFLCAILIVVIVASIASGDPIPINFGKLEPFVLEIYELFSTMIRLETALCIFFYSTYFTSIWLYLFIASSISIKFVYSMGSFGNWLMGFLDVDNKPFRTMGITITAYVTLSFAIISIWTIALSLGRLL